MRKIFGAAGATVERRSGMPPYTPGDWLFIAGVMLVIFFFVAISGMRKRK